MKTLKVLLFSAEFIFLISLSSFSFESVNLASGEWAPYLSRNLPHYGAASHIITEAFKAVEVDVNYDFYPWKRTYELTKKGDYHGTPVWVFTNERSYYFNYSDVVIHEKEFLFHLKETNLTWNKISDLKGLVIGATLHTVYPPLEEAEKKHVLRIDRAGNYDTLYKRLIKKRIDAIPQVSAVGKYYLRTTLSKEDQEKIIFSDKVLREREFSLIFSKKGDPDKYYLKKFSKGLRLIKESGLYNQIIENMDKGFYDKSYKR